MPFTAHLARERRPLRQDVAVGSMSYSERQEYKYAPSNCIPQHVSAIFLGSSRLGQNCRDVQDHAQDACLESEALYGPS